MIKVDKMMVLKASTLALTLITGILEMATNKGELAKMVAEEVKGITK